jgi:hypothetical protein
LKVGSKIFTLAAVLVAGTTAVALYSLDRIAQVNREIVTVATYHAPLARILSDVEIHARNQELAYYTLLAKKSGPGRAADHQKETLEQVATSGRVVDAEMQKVLALARVFEVLGERGSVAAPVLDMRGHFEAGLAAYRNRGYGDAKAAFRRALDCVPGDACSQVFIQRLEYMERSPLPSDWDGVWQHEHK